MDVLCVIPARYGSTRLRGKPLADILGKPMIQRVYENAIRAKSIDAIVVATDDPRIVHAVQAFGGKAVLTSPRHGCGTERIAEVAATFKASIYVNVQGDEPFLRPEDVDLLTTILTMRPNREVASLCHPLKEEDRDDPNVVKVVLSHKQDAMYFSRAAIPFQRGPAAETFRHIGLYAYRRSFFCRYAALPLSPLADAEQLEQLRFLQADIPIAMGLTLSLVGPSVDTQEDLDCARRMWAQTYATTMQPTMVRTSYVPY